VLPLALLPASIVVAVDGVVLDGVCVSLLLRTTSATACCPVCGRPSAHVHSHYGRTARDLPLQGRPTVLRLTVRKFFCLNTGCSRAVFCERLPDLLPPHARSASRLADSHRAIGMALGGEAGSRLARQLGMPTSPDTLLRRVKQTATEQAPSPRVLGVDDWAIRKGQNYGTILVDLERGAVIDLLPGRDGASLKQWLIDHPGVEVISRDRASAYAQAGAEAAPDAVQVADRWHLLKNVREMLERFFERHRGKIQAVAGLLAQPLALADGTPDEPNQEAPSRQEAEAVSPAPDAQGSAGERTAQEAKRQQRLERYQQVRQRHGQGQSIRQIAKEMGLSRNAVRRYLQSDRCPDWRPGQARRSRLDGFSGWIDEQLQAGRDNAAELHRELAARGYAGSADSVRRFVTKRLAALGKKRERTNAAQPRSPPAPSARELSFDVIRAEKKRKAGDQARVDTLRGIDEEFAQVLALAAWFIALVRKEQVAPLTEWLARAEASVSPEMRGFAQGVRQDESAVSAAIREPCSNGPVEGQVNRLKVIKRQMYGRAGFGLLRLRVLNTG
jgi:transposase